MRNAIRSILLCTLVITSTHAQAMFSALYAFGDSLTDSGNAFIGLGRSTEPFPYMNSVPSAPYAPDNTFSNGQVWVEYIADDFGLSLAPSLAFGTNFALGGERTGELTFAGVDYGPVFGGVVGQASLAASGGLPNDGLYVLNGGGNDVRLAGRLVSEGDITPAEALAGIGGGATNLADAVATLIADGAETIIVSNVPDVGRTPDLQSQGAAAAQFATNLVVAFNNQLEIELTDLQDNNPGADIIVLDSFTLMNFLIDNLEFLNVTDACTLQNGGNGCSDPHNYLFWDGIHPTTAAHRLSADVAVAAVVPIPPALFLFASALTAVVAWRRRTGKV